MARRFTRGLAALLMAVACAGAWARPSLFTIEQPWLDENGRSLRIDHWHDKPTVVAMEYSECRFICSVYWRRLVQVQQEADRRGLDLEFVILSIDPENDSPAAWREYRKVRGLDRKNWHFLTGDRAMTTRAAALLGIKWWYADGHLMHDFKVVRLDRAGAEASSVSTFDAPLDALLARP